MELIKAEVNNVWEQLQELKGKLEVELTLYPEGRLTSRGSDTFFIASRESGQYKRKKIDEETTKILARKEYLIKMLPRIDALINEVAKVANSFEQLNTGRIIETMKYAYRLLPESYYQASLARPGDERESYLLRTRLWAAEPYEKSDFKPEERKHLTSQGLKVRSKSEVLCCEFYYRVGLGFRYEEVIHLNNYKLAPDFKIILPDNVPFFHEHSGMMDDEEYRARHVKKMNLYNRFNIVPWQNLLVTYDRDGTINMEEIHHLIKGGVISRINAMFTS